LKKAIGETEQLLIKQRAKNVRMKRDVSDYSAELNEYLSQLAEHELLIGELCSSPPHSTIVSAEEALLLGAGDLEEGLLSNDLESVHNRLRQLPKRFASQDLSTKIEIVETLGVAKAAAQEMLRRIRWMDKRRIASIAPRQSDANTRRLAQQQFILCNDIRQFQFG
jgi:hypothetical protein